MFMRDVGNLAIIDYRLKRVIMKDYKREIRKYAPLSLFLSFCSDGTRYANTISMKKTRGISIYN